MKKKVSLLSQIEGEKLIPVIVIKLLIIKYKNVWVTDRTFNLCYELQFCVLFGLCYLLQEFWTFYFCTNIVLFV